MQTFTKEELVRAGYLPADSLKMAERLYAVGILRAAEIAVMQRFLARLLAHNAGEGVGDFYFSRLEVSEQERFLAALTPAEREYVAGLADTADIYLALDEELLTFLGEITGRSLLFSSFYFRQPKGIVWGNYDLNYLLFCEDQNGLQEYFQIAKECGLECELWQK